MPADHEDLEFNPEPEPVAVVGWQRGVSQTLARVAAERGIDFAPMPDAVAAVVAGLVDTVEGLAAGMNGRERQWLAAALAALSTHTQLASLTSPGDDSPGDDTVRDDAVERADRSHQPGTGWTAFERLF